jgi:hypothetical protein
LEKGIGKEISKNFSKESHHGEICKGRGVGEDNVEACKVFCIFK